MLYIENYFPDWSLVIAFYVFFNAKRFFSTVLVYIFNFSERNMAISEYETNEILFNKSGNPSKALSPQNLYFLECCLQHNFVSILTIYPHFLSDQCKEIEENNRMGKIRDHFKKIRYPKGTFHVKMGTIKDRNGMDLTEAEEIKKRWQENTEELYKKDLHDPDNHDGVITHLEPDILECKVKWILANITMNKAGGG